MMARGRFGKPGSSKLLWMASLWVLLTAAIPNIGAAGVQAVPEAPDDLAAFPASRDPIRIGLQWDDNSDNETNFEVERRVRNDKSVFERIATVPANQTQFIDGNIRNNIQYQYRVRAINADGASGYSNLVTAYFGSPGKIRVEPTKLAFGTVRVGRSATRKFTVRNTGRTDLTFRVSLPEGTAYTLDQSGEIELAAGKSRKIAVTFTPTARGKQNANVGVIIGTTEIKVKLRGQGR